MICYDLYLRVIHRFLLIKDSCLHIGIVLIPPKNEIKQEITTSDVKPQGSILPLIEVYWEVDSCGTCANLQAKEIVYEIKKLGLSTKDTLQLAKGVNWVYLTKKRK